MLAFLPDEGVHESHIGRSGKSVALPDLVQGSPQKEIKRYQVKAIREFLQLAGVKL